MAIYVIGDLQGCYQPFKRLLRLIDFDLLTDKLWLVGDIVNRGVDSLALLRYIKQAGEAVTMVLGNHDLHLLMVACGYAKLHADDTLQPILDAPDRESLLHWLRQQKLLHIEGNYVMVHAGLLSTWSVSQAAQLAREVEEELRQKNFLDIFSQLYGNQPDFWQESWCKYDRLRVIVNAMTRMRICTAEGKMNLSYKGGEASIPAGYYPWFNVPKRASKQATIICGHWSALGLKITDNLIALDSGCLWGNKLTAIRLEDRKVFQVSCGQ